MDESMILHHYENSPYAEKIRLMFGLSESSWCSLISPAWPPRPNVDPLSGGYRRIPIAQLGADIFCDSSLIAQEIARASGRSELDPANSSGDARDLMLRAEGEGFFAAITSIPTPKLLATMLRNFGPLGAYRFVRDRGGLLKGGSSKPKAGDDARKVMQRLFAQLEQRLQEQPWVHGDAPGAADFAVYHPLWLHLSCKGKLPHTASKTLGWYERMGRIGHGQRREIDREEAFRHARESSPRALPAHEAQDSLEPGDAVSVQPQDYGLVPVTGTLAAATGDRVIVARETEEFGTLHVHFPRRGYALSAVG